MTSTSTPAILTIRDTKFGKSRQLPLHPTSTQALANYARVRDALCPTATAESFFLSSPRIAAGQEHDPDRVP